MKRVALVIVVLLALTGCVNEGGPEALRWMRAHPIVLHAVVEYNTGDLEASPLVNAEVDPRASDGQLLEFAERCADYVRAHPTLEYIDLVLDEQTLRVDGTDVTARAKAWSSIDRSDVTAPPVNAPPGVSGHP